MAWGVRSYLVGSIVLGVLGVLAGCSGSMFFAEREPWRHDAEVQCLGTGMIKEGGGITRVQPIRGPGAIGADLSIGKTSVGGGAWETTGPGSGDMLLTAVANFDLAVPRRL